MFLTKVKAICNIYQLVQNKEIVRIPVNILMLNHSSRLYSTKTDPSSEMKDILKNRFPSAKDIQVVDVSGGCGAMYEILVESVDFKGLTIVKQHRLINDALREHIKDMHGLRIQTIIPKD